MLLEMLKYPVARLAERIRVWVRSTIAEAMVRGATEGIAEGLAKLESAIDPKADVSPPELKSSGSITQDGMGVVERTNSPSLPFCEPTSTAQKRGRGRPRKQINHDTQ
jgi:hypothetical protein